MKLVTLQGVLMDNNEFICSGRTIFLADDEIEKYVKEELTNDEKISIERAFDLLINQECDQIDYSELLNKLKIYKRE